MLDKRKHRRRSLASHLSVFSEDKKNPVGQLLNLSQSGLMLRSKMPFESSTVFRFSIVLPRRIFGEREITFNAKSIWCQRSEDFSSYHAGFQLQNTASENLQLLKKLISRFDRLY
jgi:hypothetical protein